MPAIGECKSLEILMFGDLEKKMFRASQRMCGRLDDCHLGDKTVALLAETIATHPSLDYLSLVGNNLGDAAAESLGRMLSANKKLAELVYASGYVLFLMCMCVFTLHEGLGWCGTASRLTAAGPSSRPSASSTRP
jgi:hypothetical protein